MGTYGDYIGGVAYNSKLYALKGFADNAPGALLSDLLAAWDWCITHQYDDLANPILVMSNSWGIYGLPFADPTLADQFDPAFTAAADTATAAGMTILAASGNDGFAGQGISWPAAMSKVISVGAVYDTTDQVAVYSNSHEILDILAPADPMYTTDMVGAGGYWPGDYYPYFAGTSSACPFAAGAVAVIQRAAYAKTGGYLTPNEVRSVLVMTGDPVTDTKVAITKPRINLGAAIGGLGGLPIYIEQGCVLNEWVAPDTNDYWGWEPNYWDAAFDSNVIEEDPNFIYGYYLSQFAAGQPVESNCVDGGSRSAVAAGLSTRTTRIDGIRDRRAVDMGYHYAAGVNRYDLTVIIVKDANNPDDPNN
ncbi:MAG TPA: S8 family serine peptidase, partial [Anaerolineae bacterium]